MGRGVRFAVFDSWVQGKVCFACQLGIGRGLLCLTVDTGQGLFCLTVGHRARFAVLITGEQGEICCAGQLDMG